MARQLSIEKKLKTIPIYCNANFEIGSYQSVFYENKSLMNCKILSKHMCSIGQFYQVEIIEYPAKKRINL